RPLAYSRGVFCFAGEAAKPRKPRSQRTQRTKKNQKNPRGEPEMLDDSFHVYDTTLRDGAQQEGLNLTVADKLVIARQLDGLGVGFIEGGWPGAIPKDTDFSRRAATDRALKPAQLAAFGATRRPGVKAADDTQ